MRKPPSIEILGPALVATVAADNAMKAPPPHP